MYFKYFTCMYRPMTCLENIFVITIREIDVFIFAFYFYWMAKFCLLTLSTYVHLALLCRRTHSDRSALEMIMKVLRTLFACFKSHKETSTRISCSYKHQKGIRQHLTFNSQSCTRMSKSSQRKEIRQLRILFSLLQVKTWCIFKLKTRISHSYLNDDILSASQRKCII